MVWQVRKRWQVYMTTLNKEKTGLLYTKDKNMKLWADFWRKNPQLFVRDYLKVTLYPYQNLLFYQMNKVDNFMYIAARGRFGRPTK